MKIITIITIKPTISKLAWPKTFEIFQIKQLSFQLEYGKELKIRFLYKGITVFSWFVKLSKRRKHFYDITSTLILHTGFT